MNVNMNVLMVGLLALGLLVILVNISNPIAGFAVADPGEDTPPEVEVTIDTGEETFTYFVEIGNRESALDALIRVSTVEYETHGELGASVTSINGLKADGSHYWLYFVNGDMNDLACSHYYPNNGDVIEFRYLTAEQAAEYF